MVDKAKAFLLTKGYQVVRETSNIVMFRETEDRIYLILVTEFSRKIPNKAYVQAAENLKRSYESITGKTVQFLNICYTADGMFDEELELVNMISGIWFVARDTGKIYVFENQPDDFDNIYHDLEHNCQKVENRIRYVPYSNLTLVLLNSLIFIFVYRFLSLAETERVLTEFGLDWEPVIQNAEWYRLLTCMFLHADAAHVYGNMLLLFFIGNHMEECLGHSKYLLLYITTGLVASLGSMVYHYSVMETVICIGASGAIMGVLGAMTGLLIVYKGKSKQFTLRRLFIFFGLTIAQGALAPQVDNAAHLCGFFAGILFAFLCYRQNKKTDKKFGF